MDFTLNISSLPWPDGTLKLFREGTASVNVAWIPESSRDWYQYALGYQSAYEKLFETWSNSSVRPDTLVYPIVFLCRHYVELRLKELIQMCHSLLDIPEDWKCNHRIDDLWQHVRPHIRTIWPNDPENDLNHTEELIREFAELDPLSMAFRYPTDREGEMHLRTVQRLDVTNLRDAMAQLASFLDAVCQGTSVYLDERRNN